MTLAACLLLASCGGRAPEPPKPGTPEFFWVVAHASFGEGDFEAAHRNLDQLTLSENPYRKDASVWLMVLSAGLARGAMDWAGHLDQNSGPSDQGRIEFRSMADAARKTADQHAMHLAELVRARHDGPPDGEVLLAFIFPGPAAGPPPQLGMLRKGVPPPAADAESLREAVEQRAVALTLCRLANTGSDIARARAFLTGQARLAPEAFEWYLAQELDALSGLYAPDQLSQQARATLLLTETAEALAAAGDAPRVRELSKKVGDQLRLGRQ